jgi:putative oxidoreductase
MPPLLHRILLTHAPRAVWIIRLMVGGIFLSEGIQKFLFPAQLAAGRFAKIGLPAPEVLGPFVGGVELICGLLVLLGLFTRVAAIPLLITMFVAMLSIKIPILFGQELWGFSLRPLPRYGFWAMLHESRNDLCMILGATFLLVVGAGPWSIDARLTRDPR